MHENIKLIFREDMDMEIQALKEKRPDIKIFSISKINNYNTCPKQFYHTYIQEPKPEQKPGIYGILGTACHTDLENVYEERTYGLENNSFKEEWAKCQIFNINFPTETIKNNYLKDVATFYNIYKPMKGKFISELGFLLEIDTNHYLMGYIDLLELREDGKVNIYDFKTSAMFKDKKLQEAGRQLCIYQMALEQLYGLETEINAWQMLKYVDVTVGKNKTKTVSCREWVSKINNQLKTLMKKHGMDEGSIDIMLAMCEQDNNIDRLPEEIRTQVEVNIHVKEYEITDEIKMETIKYIKDTIAEIEKKDSSDISNWQSKPNQFFCQHLCGFGGTECFAC